MFVFDIYFKANISTSIELIGASHAVCGTHTVYQFYCILKNVFKLFTDVIILLNISTSASFAQNQGIKNLFTIYFLSLKQERTKQLKLSVTLSMKLIQIHHL